MAGCVMYDIIAVVGGFRSVIGMATVANMMSQVMRNKAKVTDPVSTAVYKQFKQASGSIIFYSIITNIFYCISLVYTIIKNIHITSCIDPLIYRH